MLGHCIGLKPIQLIGVPVGSCMLHSQILVSCMLRWVSPRLEKNHTLKCHFCQCQFCIIPEILDHYGKLLEQYFNIPFSYNDREKLLNSIEILSQMGEQCYIEIYFGQFSIMIRYLMVYGKLWNLHFNASLSSNHRETDQKMHGTRIWEWYICQFENE